MFVVQSRHCTMQNSHKHTHTWISICDQTTIHVLWSTESKLSIFNPKKGVVLFFRESVPTRQSVSSIERIVKAVAPIHREDVELKRNCTPSGSQRAMMSAQHSKAVNAWLRGNNENVSACLHASAYCQTKPDQNSVNNNCFTVVPALGDPRRERPPALYDHVINAPTDKFQR